MEYFNLSCKKARLFCTSKSESAFSLVEMLMALLIASLLLVALAPVMTKRFNESIKFEGTVPGTKTKTHEIVYGSLKECSKIVTDSDGSQYCEGEFVVPNGYNGTMKVTLIGAGGGGGTAPTAGFAEYITAGDTHIFKVPAMVNEVTSTLISGGLGGGPGGQTLVNNDWLTGGTFNWNVPTVARSKNIFITACGGGGGGGGSWVSSPSGAAAAGGGGGSGGYRVNIVTALTSQATAQIFIGGGGGGGGGDDSRTAGTGRAYGGGGGGHELGDASRVPGSAPGGAGGYSASNSRNGMLNALGGTGAGDGSIALNSWAGGAGSTGGSGGAGGGINEWLQSILNNAASTSGGGGGGPEGGGGGGGSSAGSGGGGGGATILKQNGVTLFNIGGGGGGAGTALNIAGISGNSRSWTGGGGGGGLGGGMGGGGGELYGRGGMGGIHGALLNGGKIATVWGENYCSGGNGGIGSSTYENSNGKTGNDGAMRISYLSYGHGASGGGSGRVHADKTFSVTPDETLKVVIGKGAKGGTPGSITNAGVIQNPIEAACSVIATNIQRNNVLVVGDSINATCGGGSYPGSSKGIACGPHVAPYASEGGWIYSSLGSSWPVNGGMSSSVPEGYFSTNGRPAGDGPNLNCNEAAIDNGSTGGRGGTVTTPYTGTCIPGKGGTLASPSGGNASGYGCGGGGGYGLAKGGDGSSGYGRISWNKVWNTTKKDYDLVKNSTGGGGASGNTLTYTINVRSGQIIKIRIGKGGSAAKVVNNATVESTKGGDTVFGKLKAGGGSGGKSPSIDSSRKIVNGIGGSASNICHNGTTSLLNDIRYCMPGLPGKSGGLTSGGSGADKVTYGTGGAGGNQDIGDNSNGKNASGYGAGGGGAALRDLGRLDSPSLSTGNVTTGGSGTNGKILLEWYE